MLGMINPEKNAQHTAESMPIRQQDILTLVKANATNHPQDLQTLKALRDNPHYLPPLISTLMSLWFCSSWM